MSSESSEFERSLGWVGERENELVLPDDGREYGMNPLFERILDGLESTIDSVLGNLCKGTARMATLKPRKKTV
jgi:hypothetical protein